jgi:hypothetical protein
VSFALRSTGGKPWLEIDDRKKLERARCEVPRRLGSA